MSISISVQELGPIRRGKVELGPLTVFVGANNSGKSVLAAVAYAAVLAARWGPADERPQMRKTQRGFIPPLKLRDLRDLRRPVHEMLANGRIDNPPEPVLAFLTSTLEKTLSAYGARLTREVERCFGARIQDLVRIGAGQKAPSRLSISVSNSDPKWTVEVGAGKTGATETKVLTQPKVRALIKQLRKEIPSWFENSEHRLREDPEFVLWDYATFLNFATLATIPDFAYYMPAARSGILNSHRALAAFVLRQTPLLGVEELGIPRMSGIATDFVSELLTLDPKHQTRFSALANQLESGLLKGNVRITGGSPYPEIEFLQGKGRYPLHRTSSMVSELAPVVLFLRHLVDPGEMLVIEEPESHLHPGLQLALARVLASMINSGVQVVLTTHSDYFLTQLNNLIRAGTLQAASARVPEAGRVPKRARLEAERVRAYLFARSSTNAGTSVRRMEVTPDEGISEEEFGRVADALYKTTVRLKRELANNAS